MSPRTAAVVLLAAASACSTARKPVVPAFPSGLSTAGKARFLLDAYVRLMQGRKRVPPAEIDSPYLQRFVYRPIEVASEHRLPKLTARDLFNNILDETYFPVVVRAERYTKHIIDPLPAGELERLERNPDAIPLWPRPGAPRRIGLVRPEPANAPGGPLVVALVPAAQASHEFIEASLREDAGRKMVLIAAGPAAGVDRLARAAIDEIYRAEAQADYAIESRGPDADRTLADAVRDRVRAYFAATPALPRRLHFRGPTGGISFRYYVVLRDGHVYLKSNEEFTGVIEAWRRLAPPAIPADLKSPVALSADGVALLIEEEDGTLVRSGEFFEAPNRWVWERRMGWLGLPLLSTNVLKRDPARQLGWDVTDNSARVGWEEDLLGIPYPFAAGIDFKPGGIAQIYSLGRDGLSIYSNDFWVTADWRRVVDGLFRGRLKMRSLSASGSTMFVITEKGDLYTRYWNYNTSGASETSSYTLDPQAAGADGAFATRFLPTEPWHQQPPIVDEGEITDRITILQTGHPGNHARELRVEGRREGVTGYFAKWLFEDAWRFVPTGEPLQGRVIENRAAAHRTEESLAQDGLLAPSQDRDYAGVMHLHGERPATLAGFNLYSTPAELRIKAGASDVSLAVHTGLVSPLSSNKDDFFRKPLEPIEYLVYLELPEPLPEDTEAQRLVRALRGTWKNEGGRYFRATLSANEETATLRPVLANPFLALSGDLREIRLQAAPPP